MEKDGSGMRPDSPIQSALESPEYRGGVTSGRDMKRLASCTAGGPGCVDVEGGKIVRVTPVDLAGDDKGDWVIEARGKESTLPLRTTLSPRTMASNGEHDRENRGICGDETIGWDESLNLVDVETTRVKHGGIDAVVTSSQCSLKALRMGAPCPPLRVAGSDGGGSTEPLACGQEGVTQFRLAAVEAQRGHRDGDDGCFAPDVVDHPCDSRDANGVLVVVPGKATLPNLRDLLDDHATIGDGVGRV